jgi:serine/threonine protein phosphatase PrpC
VRPFNEDYHRGWQFPISSGPLAPVAVADGLGGAAAGQLASKLAMEVLDESFSLYRGALERGGPDNITLIIAEVG